MKNEEIFKNRIRVLRAEKKISQDDLAKSISVSRQTINSIENEKFIPSAMLALKIVRYFDTNFENVFYLSKN